jgi:hypothetical protein
VVACAVTGQVQGETLIPTAAERVAVDTGLDYLGQEPPGPSPRRFPPDSLLADGNRAWHGGPVFSPALDEMYWTEFDDVLPAIFAMEIEDGAWGPVHNPSFVNLAFGESCPIFSVSGDSLFFLSDRPERGIYMVTRTADDWSMPTRIEIPVPDGIWLGWQFAITRDASIFYELWDANGLDLYVTRPVGGQYLTSERLGGDVNSLGHDFAPYVHPDERYIVFNSNRAGGYGFNDLYVSFTNHAGGWTSPQNLGPDINTWFEDTHPFVSPDGLYLFFTTQRAGDQGYNPYWMSSAVIDSIENAVPTELQNFFAEYKESGIEITWRLNEIGIDARFHIWRSEVSNRDYHELDNSTVRREGLSFYYVDKTYQPGSAYRYRVDVADELGRRTLLETEVVFAPISSLVLNQNRPNPFNPATKISFSLPEKSQADLSIFDPKGNLVRTLVNGSLDRGSNEYVWDGRDASGNLASSGIYFYRLKAGKKVMTRKMVLLK